MKTLILLAFLCQSAELAKKCGSEVKWETSWEAAREKSIQEKKPICWYVTTVTRSPMDRKKVIDQYMKMGPFMSETLIDVLNRRFIPLRMKAKGEAAEQFGIRRLDFIEPGLVFVGVDGKAVHLMNRLSTYNEEWFLDQMFLVLGQNEFEMALKKEKDSLARAILYRRLRMPKEAAAELARAGEGEAVLREKGVLALKQHQYKEAGALLKDRGEGESQFLRGAALHLTGRDSEARDLWKKLEKSGGRWSWKAAAELRREGPFSRGFEELGWLPEDAYGKRRNTTALPRSEKERDAIVRRGVAFLLKHCKAEGVWNDSNYDYAGKDSLPDVYFAGTALAALALHRWVDVAPEAIRRALTRVDTFLGDEKKLATTNDQERAWAHLFRILYLTERGGHDGKVREIVGLLRKMQKKDGVWYHEYTNPFVSASALHALHVAKKAGVEVDASLLRRGAIAVAASRSKAGSFSYSHRGSSSPIQSAAGRMPICEYALFLNGKSDAKTVGEAIEKAFEFHPVREKVRKYDDHADQWGNGGFFFYYDLLGIYFAAEALPEGEGKKVRKRLGEIVLSIGEVDGSWQDSHELGKTYGTAIALILLSGIPEK